MRSKRKFFFRNFIIDKEFQYSYIKRDILLLLFLVISIGAIVVGWNNYRFKRAYLINPPSSEDLLQWANKYNIKTDSVEFACQFIIQAEQHTFFDLIWRPLLALFIANFLILLISGIYFSYKIAGPIYRLKKILKSKIEGQQIGPIVFRKGDPFQELADLINKAFDLH